MSVMGVDPGVRGGLAVLCGDGTVAHVCAFRPDMTHGELVGAVRRGLEILAWQGGHSVFVEKVGYMPGDGGKGANTFGRVDGLIRGALHAIGYPPTDVSPMTWQAAMECLTGGNKNVSKNKAKELYPDLKMTHAIADALLIARYGWLRLNQGPRG
jgi:hypothetical protein